MNKQKTISFDEVSRELDKGIAGADKLRADELERLAVARRAKDAGLKREQARLGKKLGAAHPRVAEIAGRLMMNAGILRDLNLEAVRARTEIPQVDEKSWAVHGYVRDKDLKGVPNLTVALYDDRGQLIQEAGYACTEKNGYFKLLHSRTKPGVMDVGKEGEAPKTGPGERVYVHVINAQGTHLHVDKQPLTPEPGRVDYREIILGDDEAVCRPPESAPGPRPGKDEGKERIRYLGNSGTRELHDMTKVTSRCQIDEIRPDHRAYFNTQREAQEAGYGYCAYCFGKEKSKR
jgi:hypothetical protein